MINKVEICGVNTSSLKSLSSSENEKLLKRIKQGETSAKDVFIKGNLKLVLSVIQRFSGRGECMDDLFQVGCIGLIKSIDNFDMSQGVKFSTYAVPMIIGEIRRYLRDNNSIRVSRSMRDTAYKVLSAKEQLTKKNNSEPTIEQISQNTGICREEIVIALDAIVEPISLSEPVYNDGGDAMYVMDQVSSKTDNDSDWVDELSLKQAVSQLTPREKNILYLRYFSGKTQMEVSSEIGISQAQVSRLEKNALDKIKSYV